MMQDEVAREKTAIAELIARYNLSVDHNDFQGYAACFAPDGIFEGGSEGVGLDQVASLLREFLLPAALSLTKGEPFNRIWPPGGPWQPI